MRCLVAIVVVFAVFLPPVDAAVIIDNRLELIDGFTVSTLTAVSDLGPIRGFDFEGDSAIDNDFGIFGSLKQINPFGLPTVFSNNNAAIAAIGEDVRLDTQFLFNGTDTPPVTVPDGFSSESRQRLTGTFAAAAPLGDSVTFARVVLLPDSKPCLSRYEGVVVVGDSFTEVHVSGSLFCPEPSCGWLAAVILGARRRR